MSVKGLDVACPTREFGFELSLKAHSEDVKSKNDALMLMIHWRMLRHSFLCIGDLNYAHFVPTELLPINLGWIGDNQDTVYTARYVYCEILYTLFVQCNAEGTCCDVKLSSDTEVARFALDVTGCVDDDLTINMERCHQVALDLDTNLIQPVLYARRQTELMGLADCLPPGGTLTQPSFCL